MPALTAIVIRHWAQDGKVHLDTHANGKHHNVVQYGSMQILLKAIVSLSSFDGQTVIDGIRDSGISEMARTCLGRRT